MTWTSGKPVVDGWYWYRSGRATGLLMVEKAYATLWVMQETPGRPGFYKHTPLTDYPGEWAGPVEPPQ